MYADVTYLHKFFMISTTFNPFTTTKYGFSGSLHDDKYYHLPTIAHLLSYILRYVDAEGLTLRASKP